MALYLFIEYTYVLCLFLLVMNVKKLSLH